MKSIQWFIFELCMIGTTYTCNMFLQIIVLNAAHNMLHAIRKYLNLLSYLSLAVCVTE